VTDNVIVQNDYGIWLTPSTIVATGLSSNHYINLGTPVFLAS
jgi:hypothetical protein